MNQQELLQCHAVIYTVKAKHNPEELETPWALYESLCELFDVPHYLKQFDVTRLTRLPRLELQTTEFRRKISTDYQLLKFHQAVDFMLLSVTEEQYGYIIQYLDESKSKAFRNRSEYRIRTNVYPSNADIPSQTNELFEQFDSASVPKEVADK